MFVNTYKLKKRLEVFSEKIEQKSGAIRFLFSRVHNEREQTEPESIFSHTLLKVGIDPLAQRVTQKEIPYGFDTVEK